MIVFYAELSKGESVTRLIICHLLMCVKICQVLEKEAFQKQMLEKLIWICSFMLVGTRHGGVSVGVVEKEFTSDVSFALDYFSKTPRTLSINH